MTQNAYLTTSALPQNLVSTQLPTLSTAIYGPQAANSFAVVKQGAITNISPKLLPSLAPTALVIPKVLTVQFTDPPVTTLVNGAGQTISHPPPPTMPSVLVVDSTAGFDSNGGTLVVAGVNAIVSYSSLTTTTFVGCTVASGGPYTAIDGGAVSTASPGTHFTVTVGTLLPADAGSTISGSAIFGGITPGATIGYIGSTRGTVANGAYGGTFDSTPSPFSVTVTPAPQTVLMLASALTFALLVGSAITLTEGAGRQPPWVQPFTLAAAGDVGDTALTVNGYIPLHPFTASAVVTYSVTAHVTVSVVPSGGTVDDKRVVVPSFPLAAGDVVSLRDYLVEERIGPGDTIYAQADAAGVVDISMSGVVYS